MKKITAMLVLLAVLFCLSSAALAVNEDVEGELVIYSSAYPEVLDMLDEALKKEFPNLTPGVNGSFFFYSGSGKLISRISGEMGPDRDQPLECDMLMMAEPSYSLEMKDYGYLHPFTIDNADTLKAHVLKSDNTYEKVDLRGKTKIGAQAALMEEALQAAANPDDPIRSRTFIPATRG